MAALPDGQSLLVEDFAYPGADVVLEDHGLKVFEGDGHLSFVTSHGYDEEPCEPGQLQVERMLDVEPYGTYYCFQTSGTQGYLTLEVPSTFLVRGGDTDVTATANIPGEGQQTVEVPAGESVPVAPGEGSELPQAILVELRFGPPSVPAGTPAAAPVSSTVRVEVGGERACSGALINAWWIATARSCFTGSADGVLAGGAPSVPTRAIVGRADLATTGGQDLGVTHLVPHAERDVVLARLSAAVTGVTAVPVAAAAPAAGDTVLAAGYGRTAESWSAGAVRASSYTVSGTGAATLDLLPADSGLLCKGDAGGPTFRETDEGRYELVGLHSAGTQAGCFGVPAGTQTATDTRLDDLRSWIAASAPEPAEGPFPSSTTVHVVRGTDGTWAAPATIDGFGTPTPAGSKDVAVATLPDGSAQVVMIGLDDGVYHRVRSADGTWSQFQPLAGNGTPTTAKARRVAIAGLPDGSAQLVIIGADGGVYHQVRAANGGWSGFQPLNGIGTTATAIAKDVAIAGLPNGTAQVVIVGQDNGVYHRVRHANGTWDAFAPLNGTASRVAITGMPDGATQLVVAGTDGRLFHRARYANGAWTEFAGLDGAGTPTQAVVKDVAIASLPDGSATVTVVGADDAVYDRVRRTNGTWTEFGQVTGPVTGTVARAANVATAGAPSGQVHLLLTAR